MNISITYPSGLTYSGINHLKHARYALSNHIRYKGISLNLPRNGNNEGLYIRMTASEAEYLANSLLAQVSKLKLLKEEE